jgi:hypothetical protein
VIGSPEKTKAVRLGKSGTIFARVTLVPDIPDKNLILKLRGVDLKYYEGLLHTPDVYFEVAAQGSSLRSGSYWIPIFRSETATVSSTSHPCWDVVSVSVSRVCCGDFDKPIQFRFFNRKATGGHFFM